MRRLVPLRQLIEDAEENGEDVAHMVVDPDDVCSVNPDELDDQEDLEENPDEEE